MGIAETLKTQLSLDLRHLHHWVAIFFLVTVVFKLTQLIVKRRQWLWALEQFPGPPQHWLYGHVHEVGVLNHLTWQFFLNVKPTFMKRVETLFHPQHTGSGNITDCVCKILVYEAV